MFLLYTLKGLGLAATAVIAEFWASGQCLLGIIGVVMLLVMWYATRLYARRRARGEPA